ncbi:hypothetical protein IFO70_04195 [Phormidium tenue FACHB-886]|nr:hypothetical protein [Phormidium tenue FACHB-886]
MITLTSTSAQLRERLRQTIDRILASGKITTVDRLCLLKAALSRAPIHPHDAQQIRQVFDRLQMGLLKVVD